MDPEKIKKTAVKQGWEAFDWKVQAQKVLNNMMSVG